MLFQFRLPARSSWQLCPSGLLPIGCPETAVRNYHYLRNNQEQRSYRTRIFMTAFTRFLLLSLLWLISIQSMSHHPGSWRFNFRLSSHLRLGLPIKTPYASCSPSPPPIRAISPTNSLLFDFITRIIFWRFYFYNINVARTQILERKPVAYFATKCQHCAM